MKKPASTGDGTSFSDTRLQPGVAERIEELGRLNDRRLTCAANRDVDGLRVIAAEYAGRNMLQTAHVIYKQIEIMIKEKL